MNHKHKTRAAHLLRVIASEDSVPSFRRQWGICSNFSDLLEDEFTRGDLPYSEFAGVMDLLYDAFVALDLDSVYPLGYYEFSRKDLWEGEHGRRRRLLAALCAEWIEAGCLSPESWRAAADLLHLVRVDELCERNPDDVLVALT